MQEQFHLDEFINALLGWLPQRESRVIRFRFGFDGSKPLTLQKIGAMLEVTRERVRQIERASIVKIKQHPTFPQVMKPIRHVIIEEIIQYGGARSSEHLQYSVFHASHEHPGYDRMFHFLTEHLIDDIVPARHPSLNRAWQLKDVKIDHYAQILDELMDIFFLEQEPLVFEEVWKRFSGRQFYKDYRQEWMGFHPLPDEEITDDHLRNNVHAILEMARDISQNPFGEWGLKSWPSIAPRRMSDKIYLVLKKHGSPLHFQEITDLVNKVKFDHKVAHAPTVHNELILDKRFVLIGRGIYALKEWGYREGVVADVIAEVLRDAATPLDRDQIVEEVGKRRIVKRGTVYLALSDKTRFQRLSDGRYILAS